MAKWKTVYQGRTYQPTTPTGDFDALASEGDRLMFRHDITKDGPEFFVAPRGELNAGWVIGIFKE